MSTKVARKGLAVSVDAKDLREALTRVSKGADARSSVKVITGVHLAVENDYLVARTTDLSIALREEIPIDKGVGDPCVVAPLSKLIDGLKTLEGDLSLKVKLKEAKLTITDEEGTTLTYELQPEEDFPAYPLHRIEGVAMRINPGLAVPAGAFRIMHDRIARCASKDPGRPVLQAIQLEHEDGALIMAATDSYRLGVDRLSPVPGEFMTTLVGASELTKAIKFVTDSPLSFSQRIEGEGEKAYASWLVISAGGRQACIRRIEGQFPNYRQLLPENFEGAAIVDRAALEKAAGRIAKLSTHNSPARVQPLNGQLWAWFEGYDGPSVTTKLDAEFEGVWEFPIGVNPEFLRDCVQGLGGDKARLNVIHQLRPLLLTGPQFQNGRVPEHCYLIMPIRLPQ